MSQTFLDRQKALSSLDARINEQKVDIENRMTRIMNLFVGWQLEKELGWQTPKTYRPSSSIHMLPAKSLVSTEIPSMPSIKSFETFAVQTDHQQATNRQNAIPNKESQNTLRSPLRMARSSISSSVILSDDRRDQDKFYCSSMLRLPITVVEEQRQHQMDLTCSDIPKLSVMQVGVTGQSKASDRIQTEQKPQEEEQVPKAEVAPQQVRENNSVAIALGNITNFDLSLRKNQSLNSSANRAENKLDLDLLFSNTPCNKLASTRNNCLSGQSQRSNLKPPSKRLEASYRSKPVPTTTRYAPVGQDLLEQIRQEIRIKQSNANRKYSLMQNKMRFNLIARIHRKTQLKADGERLN